MRILKALIAALALASVAAAQEPVSFPAQDGGVVNADLYGEGTRGVVLAHGGRFDKGSWKKQAQELAKAGFRVLAIDFRGYGQSQGPGMADPLSAPLHLDVLAAVLRPYRWSGPAWAAVPPPMPRLPLSRARLIG